MSETESAIAGLVDLVHAQSEAKDVSSAFRSALRALNPSVGDPAWTDGFDVAAEAYQRVLSNSERRPLGQFFTPLWIGKLLSEWALRNSPANLFDPACGTGSLLIAATKLDLPVTTPRLVGQDIDPLVLELADTNRRVRRMGSIEFVERDFLTEEPTVQPESVVCNPPYTRHQALTPETKQKIHEGFERRVGTRFSRLSSLHALFLARAIEVSAPGALIAFITPSHWLDMNYGREVKEFLLDRATVEAFIEFPATERIFGMVHTTATITLIRNTPRDAKHLTRFYSAHEPDQRAQLSTLMTSANQTAAKELTSRTVWHPKRGVTKGVPLSEFISVGRGLATGRNSYFVLTEDAKHNTGAPDDWLLPCAPAPRNFDGAVLNDETFAALGRDVPRWLLAIPHDQPVGAKLADYIANGKSLGVPDGFLVNARTKGGKPWYSIGQTNTPPILFSYFNRENARFIRNAVGAVPLNNWLGISPLDGVDSDRLFAVLGDPECIEALKASSRTYSNGLWKLEPREMMEVKIPKSLADRLR